MYNFVCLHFALQQKPLPPGPSPPDLLQKNLITLVPPVLYDTPKWGRNFGDCIQQPPKAASPGDTIAATFVSGFFHISDIAFYLNIVRACPMSRLSLARKIRSRSFTLERKILTTFCRSGGSAADHIKFL